MIKLFALPQFLPSPSPTLNPPKLIFFLSLKKKKKKQNRQATITTTTNTWNTHPEMGMYLSNPSRLRTPCERGSRKIIRAKVVGDSKETVFSDTAELTHI